MQHFYAAFNAAFHPDLDVHCLQRVRLVVSIVYKAIISFTNQVSLIIVFVITCFSVLWLVGFVALRPKSTAMVIAGRSVHLTTGLNKRLTSNCAHTFACN